MSCNDIDTVDSADSSGSGALNDASAKADRIERLRRAVMKRLALIKAADDSRYVDIVDESDEERFERIMSDRSAWDSV